MFKHHLHLQLSQRVQQTDAPVIVNVKKLMASREDVLSLAQGIVHWQPPPQALQVRWASGIHKWARV